MTHIGVTASFYSYNSILTRVREGTLDGMDGRQKYYYWLMTGRPKGFLVSVTREEVEDERKDVEIAMDEIVTGVIEHWNNIEGFRRRLVNMGLFGNEGGGEVDELRGGQTMAGSSCAV